MMRGNKEFTQHLFFYQKVPKKIGAGFTLVELLVVIAIIGIFSIIVLASLNSARFRGADTAIQDEIVQIRSQAEIFHSNNLSYGVVANDAGNPMLCDNGAGGLGTAVGVAGSLFADPIITRQIREIKNNSGEPWVNVMCVSNGVGANAESWALSVPFKSDSTKHLCIDSSGSPRQISAKLGAGQTSCQ